MPRIYGATHITQAPTQDDIDHPRREFPDALFQSHVSESMELTDLPNQDSYSFELTEDFRRAMRILDFRFSQRWQPTTTERAGG